jgi:hypothetical protein
MSRAREPAIRSERLKLLHVLHETVTLPGNGDDKPAAGIPVLARGVAKNLAQRRYLLVEVVFLHHAVAPHRLHQSVLLNRFVWMRGQVMQRLERARRNFHRHTVRPDQQAPPRIQNIARKNENRLRRSIHRDPSAHFIRFQKL